jgi:lambda repressor-like predicted transcriptional regulator
LQKPIFCLALNISLAYFIGMDPKEITRQLKGKGYSVAAIAASLGVASPTVSQTIHGRTVSARIRAAIAEALGRSVEEIWPVPTGKEAA